MPILDAFSTVSISMHADLHCHSTASDGTLGPEALIARARQAGVTLLSVTDHDTLAAYEKIATGTHGDLTLVPGVEFSTTWHDTGIHVVGLNTAPASEPMQAAVSAQQAARAERAATISKRLAANGLPDLLEAARAEAGEGTVGRPHFARAMVAAGLARSEQAAFRRYLGRGRVGDVRECFASLEQVIAWIRQAGGVAVLAHPAHYRLSRRRRQRLISDFSAAGGGAVEVISGRQEIGRASCRERVFHVV